MKKLYILFVLCFISTIQADDLSDAIRTSDVEKVEKFLAPHKLTNKQIIKYLDTAEQTLRVRRDSVTLNNWFADPFSDVSKGIALFGVGSYLVALKATIDRDFLLAPLGYCSALASCLAVLLIEGKSPSTAHAKAIAIKEMLYDCLDDWDENSRFLHQTQY